MAATATSNDAVEHTAPGEEQVVFSRKAGVVASKISYVGVLDSANDWQVIESPHDDDASALACQFNHLGTHFMVGDEGGRIDLWSLVPLRLYVKSLDLTSDLLDSLIPPAPCTENANGSTPPAGSGTGKEKRKHGQEHGWSAASVYWSRCSRYIVAAYVQKKKTWPGGEEVLLPGMVLLWNVAEAQVEGYLRLRSRIAHVTLSPMDPRRGSVCCMDGTSFLLDFPPVVLRSPLKEPRSQRAAKIASVDSANSSASIGAVSDGDGNEGIAISAAAANTRTPFVGGEQQRQQQSLREQAQSQKELKTRGERAGEGLMHGAHIRLTTTAASWLPTKPSATWQRAKQNAFRKGRDQEQEEYNTFFGSIHAGDVGTDTAERAATKIGEATESCYGGDCRSIDSARSHGGNQEITATVVTYAGEERSKVDCLRLAGVGGSGTVGHTRRTGTEDLLENQAGCGDIVGVFGNGIEGCSNTSRGSGSRGEVKMNSTGYALRARTIKVWDPAQQLRLFYAATSTATEKCPGTGERTHIETRAGAAAGEAAFSSASASAGVSVGAGSGSKTLSRIPVQPGRAAWCEDGETFFLLNHEGNLLKIKASANGVLSLLAIANLDGGASPATLQLTPEGDKLLVATATKGLCLVPSDDLDLSRAEMFGESFGIRGSKTRFWGAAVLGDVHGRGRDGSGKRTLTIIGNPSRSRDEKTDLFFFDPNGGQPERVDTPRREGVISLACSSLRPLLVFLCPTGEVYFREEVLKTNFPGPWYPSGYVLIDDNVDYLEAEDQLDTVVMTGANGEELSKTQAHEVVVPWQHQTVSEEEASAGAREEPVDIDGGANTEVWVGPSELRWIPQEDDTWRPLGGENERLGCPGSSSRGGVHESSGGALARLLGATPAILNDARKRFRAATASEEDAVAKRRKMVPKMVATLAAKKKKYDEEICKRKRKLQDSRTKAKRLKDKKTAAASTERAALRAASEEEMARNEAAMLAANAKATTAGQAAVDATAADGCEVVVHGKDTPVELRPLLAERGCGGGSKSCDVAVCSALPFGCVGFMHDMRAPENTPCIGSKPFVASDGWCPSGCGNDTGFDGLSFIDRVAADCTAWVAVASMAREDHQGAAPYAVPTGAGINGSCNRASLSTNRPGELLLTSPATRACVSFPTSVSSNKLSGQREMKANRHDGGEHDASSEPLGKRGAAGSTEKYCRMANPPAECAPASMRTPVCTEATGAVSGKPTSQVAETESGWDRPGCAKGGWASTTTGVLLAADARERASGGTSPFGANANSHQRLPAEHGLWGVQYSNGDGGVKHQLHSSAPLIDSPVYDRGYGHESFDAGSGRHVAPGQMMQTAGSPQSLFSPLPSSGKRTPISGGSHATSIDRGSSHRHSGSQHEQAPSCFHHFPSPSRVDQQSKTPSPSIPLPHTFRGASTLKEAFDRGQSGSHPTSLSATSRERMRCSSAGMAMATIETANVSATSHNNRNQDFRRTVSCVTRDGEGARNPRAGLELLENMLSPQEGEPSSLNMAAQVVGVVHHEQCHRGPPLYPGSHPLEEFCTIVDEREDCVPAEKTVLPSAKTNLGHGPKDGNRTC